MNGMYASKMVCFSVAAIRVGATILLLSLPAAAQSPPPPTASSPTAGPSHSHVNKFAPSGEEITFNFVASVFPDCSPRGIPRGRISVPPQHGSITFQEVESFASFVQSSPLSVCNTKKVKGLSISYKSEPDYVGEDSATIFIIFPDGSGWETDYTIVVK